MTKSSLRTIGVALTTMVAQSVGPTSAHAQSQLMKAQIPFGFYVAGQEFPPGDYRVGHDMG